MPYWAPLTYLVVVSSAVYLGRRSLGAIPVLINGLIPSLPGAKNKEESGTTVLVFYSDKGAKDPDSQILRGYADEHGCMRSAIPTAFAGRTVTIRIRHVAYVFQEFEVRVPKHGLFHTAKMEVDRAYNGQVRGAPIADLGAHYRDALAAADKVRVDAVNLATSAGLFIARVPVALWAVASVLVILSNAADFFQHAEQFDKTLESFQHALYVSVATITSLGYSGSAPATSMMRAEAAIEALFGILIVGLFLNSLFYERHPSA